MLSKNKPFVKKLYTHSTYSANNSFTSTLYLFSVKSESELSMLTTLFVFHKNTLQVIKVSFYAVFSFYF